MNQEIIDYFSENIDDIIIISLIIIALMVIFSMLNIDFNSNKNKHIEKVVTIENLENKQEKILLFCFIKLEKKTEHVFNDLEVLVHENQHFDGGYIK